MWSARPASETESTSTGAFHEGINVAAVEKLPLVIVVANNQYAYSTPNDRQFACQDLLDKAVGYGVAGHRLEATDLADCLKVVGSAIEAAPRRWSAACRRRLIATGRPR